MRKYLLFVLISVLVDNNSGWAQIGPSSFTRQWNNLMSVDDNEKNFQIISFIESVKEELLLADLSQAEAIIPSGWKYQFSTDSTYWVCSGILPFQYSGQQLLFFAVENREGQKKVHSFLKQLSNATTPSLTDLRLRKTDDGFSLDAVSGTNSLLSLVDLELKILFSSLAASRNDDEKLFLSKSIWQRLQPLLNNSQFFNNRFDDYNKLSTLLSPDGKVKICTWNIEFNDGVNQFFGGLAVKTSTGIRTFELTDNYQQIRSPEQANLTPSKWYGCIYYDLVETKFKGTTYYTLIGYNGNNAFSQIKVVDVLVISDGNNPNPRFGHPVFSDDKRTRRRLIYEYSNRATMMLRYDANQKMIVMDNLAPMEQIYQNDFRYYGPDFSYNGLKFDKGKWVFVPEIDLRNPAPGRR